MHDIIGHYNRFDIFDLRVNKEARNRLAISNAQPQTGLAPSSAVAADPSTGGQRMTQPASPNRTGASEDGANAQIELRTY
jgi:hypothetical protein